MRLTDLIRLSLSNLTRRKVRTLLTVLGVLIGTTSIVVMISLGLGMQQSQMDMINRSNELTLITIRPASEMMYYSFDGESSQDQNIPDQPLDDDAVAAIAAIPHVKLASGQLEISVMMWQGAYEGYVTIRGLSREALNDMNFKFESGGMPEEGDTSLRLIFGNRIGMNFYNPKDSMMGGYDPFAYKSDIDLMGKPLFTVYDMDAYWSSMGDTTPKPKKFLVDTAGVLEGPADEYDWSEQHFSCFADLDALKSEMSRVFRGKAWPGQEKTKTGKPKGPVTYQSIYVRTDNIENTKDVLQAITDLGYRGYSNIEYLETMRESSQMTQNILGGIGAVSLFVAAIGIMNTMMMSIYERTKEIGIFKVLGCSLGNIRNMFLYESAFIGLFGGIAGIGLSFAVSHLINTLSSTGQGGNLGIVMMMGDPTSKASLIPPWLALSALVFSTLIGMIAGLIPALRAMRLSPLAAIRNE